MNWLCVCGNLIEDGMHCPSCGSEPPWGCPCSDCDEGPDEADEFPPRYFEDEDDDA